MWARTTHSPFSYSAIAHLLSGQKSTAYLHGNSNSEKTHHPLFCPRPRLACPGLDVIPCCIDYSCKNLRLQLTLALSSGLGLRQRLASSLRTQRQLLPGGSDRALQRFNSACRKLFSIYRDPVWTEFYLFKYVERVIS